MKKVSICKLPSGWHELTIKQVLVVSKLFISNHGDKDFAVRCFLAFTGWKPLRKHEFADDNKTWFWFKSREKGTFCVDGEIYTDLVKKLDWILAEIKLISVLPDLGRSKPIDCRLYEVTLDEYLFLDSAFNAYAKTKEKRYLNRMLAIVYRRKNETWNSDRLNKMVRRFWFVPFYKKYVIFLWFIGIKGFLRTEYPYLWQDGEGSPISHAQAVLNLLSSLNNGDITKNKEIFKTHVHEAFYELNLKAEQAARLKP